MFVVLTQFIKETQVIIMMSWHSVALNNNNSIIKMKGCRVTEDH